MPETAKVIRLEPELQRHVAARLSRLPTVARNVHTKGKALLQECLEVYFESTDDALFELADSAGNPDQQNVYFDAMREVRVQRKAIERRFLELVDEGFARLMGADVRDTIKGSGELNADALSLVQNDDLEQMAAVESIVNHANGKHFVPLNNLCKFLSSFVSEAVDQQSNPFGPSLLCTGMMAQIKRLDVDVKAKLVLFELFDRVVLSSTPHICAKLVALMDRNAKRKVVPQKPEASEGAQVSSRKETLELLSFIQKLPVVANASRGMDIELVLESVQARRGKNLALGSVERETIRLVQMLFEFFFKDKSLARPAKEQLCRLQVPVLKVALLDDTFLTNKKHPARLLINEIATSALSWGSELAKSGNEGPIRIMKTSVDRIVGEFKTDIDLFESVLADFMTFSEKEKRRISILEKRTIDAEDGKARAEMARKKVESELELRTMAYELPGPVHKLIFGPWSNVLFVTALKHGYSSDDWSDQLKTVSEITWSVMPCQNDSDRRKLVKLIPVLVSKIRAGLSLIAHNPFEITDLLGELEGIHLARMRGEALSGERAEEQQAPEAEPAETEQAYQAEPEEKVEVEPVAEVQEDTPADLNLPEDDPHLVIVSNFAQGAWFDYKDASGEPTRCRLAALIKATGNYIFVNRSGMKVAEKNRYELALDLKAGLLKSLDDSQLFDRALESIVTGLRKNKSSMPLEGGAEKSE